MSLLTWKDEYALGIVDVDHEHRQMIDLINQTQRALGEKAEGEHIEAFLGEIVTLIGAHFALEERRMQQMGYAEYPQHKADHERLLDEILGLTDAYSVNPESGATALQACLSEWFGQHFRTFDARLHRNQGQG